MHRCLIFYGIVLLLFVSWVTLRLAARTEASSEAIYGLWAAMVMGAVFLAGGFYLAGWKASAETRQRHC